MRVREIVVFSSCLDLTSNADMVDDDLKHRDIIVSDHGSDSDIDKSMESEGASSNHNDNGQSRHHAVLVQRTLAYSIMISNI